MNKLGTLLKMSLSTLLITTSMQAFSSAPQCEANLTKKGSFFKGRTFSTWAVFDDTSKEVAFKNVYLNTAKSGWKISSSDEKMGTISAGNEVSYGKGKSAPLNIIIEESGTDGSKITINFSTSGGISASKKNIIKSFCETIDSVNSAT